MSAHVDRFVLEHLPSPERGPELLFGLPELHYPQRLNCAAELLDRHVRAGKARRRAVVAPGVEWTYGDLLSAANRVARVLVEDLGVVPGNRVLLRAPNTPMLAACWLAVLKAGAIAVTTMPFYRAGELHGIVEKAQVRHALCDVRFAAELRAATARTHRVSILHFQEDELEARMRSKSDTFEHVATAAGDPAIIAFTSGVTGTPKAAVHLHRDVLAICDTYAARVLRADPGDLFTGSPPLGFTYGLGGLLLFALRIGAATLLLEKASPERLLDAIDTYRASVLFTAPLAYRTMAQMLAGRSLSSLKRCVSAGEALPPATWEAWRERTGLEIMDGIGSTEMLHIFIGSPQGAIIGGSTGRVVPGYAAEVHDDAGNPVAANTVGRLAVKGPTGCRYLADDRQSAYVQRGWNYTGDAYRVDERGYFWHVARTDDLIVASGYTVSGPEVEHALLAHAEVRECAVVAKPDPGRGTNIVKAYVVLADGVEADSQKALHLQAYLCERIAPFKAPREIEFVRELPRTGSGKVQRFALR